MSNTDFINRLEDIIAARLADRQAGSYTAELANAGKKRIAQKVGEEAVELALASVDGDRDEILNEAADLMYHLLVLLRIQNIALADVTTILESRHR